VEVEHATHEENGSAELESVTAMEPVADEDKPAEDGSSASRRPSLATLLTREGIATEERIRAALEEGERTGEKLGEVIVRHRWTTEGRLAQLLAEQWGLGSVDPGALSLDPLAVSRVEIGLAAELGGFPVWFDSQGIVVAVSDPNEERFAAFRDLLGNVSFVVVPRSTLKELVESRLFGSQNKSGDGASEDREHAAGTNGDLRADTDGQLHEEAVGQTEPSVGDPVSEDGAASAAAPEPGSLVQRLRSIAAEVETLEQSLGDARSKVEAQESELAGLREAHAQDSDRIRDVEAQLAQRADRFRALREKVADLSLAFDD
jgi:MshEN domain